MEELAGILRSPPLWFAQATLGRVRLILFMHVVRGLSGYRRRVASFWEADGQGGHRLVFRWDAKTATDETVAVLSDRAGLGRYQEYLQDPLDKGEIEMEAVRHKTVKFYRGS